MKFKKGKTNVTESRVAVAKDHRYSRGQTTKGPQETFWGNVNVLYHDCGGGYTSISVCQKLFTCILKIGKLYFNKTVLNE